MFRARLTIGNALERLKGVPKAATDIFRGRLLGITPQLLDRVREIMAQEPGEPSSPFAFGTDLSMRYYFWLITQFPGLTDGDHWIRTGDIEGSWQIDVSYSGTSGHLRIFSSEPGAKYVYGPWAVAGHINTGWPDNFSRARALILRETKRVTVELWDAAVAEALRNTGLVK